MFGPVRSKNEFSDPKRRQAYYDEDKDVYFFDRHRPSFPAILYFYQSCGAMCRPLDVPMAMDFKFSFAVG